jgi:hypothetical protein
MSSCSHHTRSKCLIIGAFLLGDADARCRYIGRLHDSLHNFSARFSDIFTIHRHALETEREQAKLKWWKRLLPSFCRHYDSDSDGVLSFMATLDESQVIDLTVDALGKTLPAHRDFEVRHHIDNAARNEVRRNLTSSKRRSVGAHDTTAAASQQEKTSSPFHESAAASARFTTSCAADSASISLDDSESNEVAAAELVEVVGAIGDEAGAVVETSSGLPCSPDSSVIDKSSRQRLTKLQATNAIFRSMMRGKQSQLKLSRSQAQAADSIEIQEVVIDGGGTDVTAGVGQVQSQQQQQCLASGGQAVQRDAASVGADCTVVETAPRAAVVQKKIVAALALNSRGRGRNAPLSAEFLRPIEAILDDGFKKERSPARSAVALPLGSAASQFLPLPPSMLADSQRQDYAGASKIDIPQPPPRSRSRSRGAATITAEPLACIVGAPPPQPRSHSASRPRISGATAVGESFDSADIGAVSSKQSQITKLQATNAIFRSMLRGKQLQLKLSSSQVQAADSIEIQEVVIDGGGTHVGAGVGQV